MFYVLPVPWMVSFQSPGLLEHYKWAFPSAELWLASVNLTGWRTRERSLEAGGFMQNSQPAMLSEPRSHWFVWTAGAACQHATSASGLMSLCTAFSASASLPFCSGSLFGAQLDSHTQSCSGESCWSLERKQANSFLLWKKAHLLQTYLMIPLVSKSANALKCRSLYKD